MANEQYTREWATITLATYNPLREQIEGTITGARKFKASIYNRERILALALVTGFTKLAKRITAQERALINSGFSSYIRAEYNEEMANMPPDLWFTIAKECIGSEIAFEMRVFTGAVEEETVYVRNEYGELEGQTQAGNDWMQPIEYVSLVPTLETDEDLVSKYR
jgi:hypothetical protein